MSESLKLSLSAQSINELVHIATAHSSLTGCNPTVQIERSDGSTFEYTVSFVGRKVTEVTDSRLDFFVEHQAIDDESEIICLINKLLDKTLFEETAHTSKEDHDQKQVFKLKEGTESCAKHVGFKQFVLQGNPQKHSEPILTKNFESKRELGYKRSVSMGEQQKNGYPEPADLKDWVNQASKRVDEIGYQLKLHLDVKDILFSPYHNEVSFPEELPVPQQENMIYFDSKMIARIKAYVTLGHRVIFTGVKEEWEVVLYRLLLRF
ncbi:hypothetical protein SOPP22_00870 [Shewanella sp. OPT22]|nr:hypothetical protein SOPP22_00870 [Shewanella sp. OPT22]